jgi:DNA-binding CsgD family transcriptional regulator
MKSHGILARRADWVGLLETIHHPTASDEAWARAIVEELRPNLLRASTMGLLFFEHGPRYESVRTTIVPPVPAELEPHTAIVGEKDSFEATDFDCFFYPPMLVTTNCERSSGLTARGAARMKDWRDDAGVGDCLGIVTHPAPGFVLVVWAFHDEPIHLTPYERRVLTQTALHLETAARLRRHPETIRARITTDGRLLDGDDRALPSKLLATHARRVSAARMRDTSSGEPPLDLWTALVDGRLTLAPRVDGSLRHYAVLDNPSELRRVRALSHAEQDVLALAARGLSTKLVAYALGRSSSTVSTLLGQAAAKLGALSRSELVRIAAILTHDRRAHLPDAELTEAEAEVLELLQLGLSNREIASRRTRSIHTIANQVASLLKKTQSPSRRALVVKGLAERGTTMVQP